MKRTYSHELLIQFDTEDTEELYDGIIWYRNNLIDHLRIRNNEIVIAFARYSRQTMKECFETERSIIRFHLQKALCFMLAVTGQIPPVAKMQLICNGAITEIAHESFSCHWHNCCINTTLSKDGASQIFSEHGKQPYIVMTYFCKAQLDKFSNDAFRAAWSGLNSVINQHCNPED